MGEDIGNPSADLVHFRLAHPARGHRRAAEANSAGLERRERVERNGVLVDGDACTVQSQLGVATGEPAGVQLDEEQMIVGAAADDAKAMFGNGRGQGSGVDHDLLLILAEFGVRGFFEANRLCGDGVNERAALGSGESDAVEFLGVLRLAEDESAARAAQSLVRGGGNEIGVRQRAGMHSGGDQAGDVGHVHEENRANRFCDLAEALKIEDARIGAGPGDKHLGLVLVRELFHLVVINRLGVRADAVGRELVHLS